MKRSTTLLSTLALIAFAHAQTTALDFTANDCDGMSHQLFSDLDAGNAVILDLVMMGCQPCVTASNGIINNVIPNTSDPTRVKFYSIGYTNSISCSQMNNWKNTNDFTHTVFAGMSAQTTYYGGMGMPTVIVLGGGSGHGVYYNELGYSAGDNAALIAALNDALAGANAIEENSTPTLAVSPNPVQEELSVTGSWVSARVLDLQGREMIATPALNGKVDVRQLPAGAYVIQLTNAGGRIATARFEKR